MKAETQQTLQAIYDLFYDGGGMWPRLGDLQPELNRQGSAGIDAVRAVRRTPAALLKPMRSGNDYPAPSERLLLTAEGVARCAGSEEDVENFLTAVKWLARRAELFDPRTPWVRFTTGQLAEAVSLPLEWDSKSAHRLLAILQAEGWLKEDGTTQCKPGRVLRAIGYPALPWR